MTGRFRSGDDAVLLVVNDRIIDRVACPEK
jgi:hypothetical protein